MTNHQCRLRQGSEVSDLNRHLSGLFGRWSFELGHSLVIAALVIGHLLAATWLFGFPSCTVCQPGSSCRVVACTLPLLSRHFKSTGRRLFLAMSPKPKWISGLRRPEWPLPPSIWPMSLWPLGNLTVAVAPK